MLLLRRAHHHANAHPESMGTGHTLTFDLPAAAIQVGNVQSGQSELVGQEYEPLVGLRIDVLDAT
jgi:hypothetical protein